MLLNNPPQYGIAVDSAGLIVMAWEYATPPSAIILPDGTEAIELTNEILQLVVAAMQAGQGQKRWNGTEAVPA